MGEVSYAPLIEDMTWSYSRLNSFHSCKYQWFLHYIAIPAARRAELFFSSYGSFIHSILERINKGQLPARHALAHYLSEYPGSVGGDAPSEKVKLGYFQDGLRYFSALQQLPDRVISVEEKVEFSLDGRRFQGFVDLVRETPGGLLVVEDNKSRKLKPRSNRAKPTKTDQELDEYLRQLYLYSIPVFEKLGKYPDLLCFNCFRDQIRIEEPFRPEALEEAKQWALDTISEIFAEEEFPPDIDYFRCRYLCDYKEHCEFFELSRR